MCDGEDEKISLFKDYYEIDNAGDDDSFFLSLNQNEFNHRMDILKEKKLLESTLQDRQNINTAKKI
jgi:hypothetical protein